MKKIFSLLTICALMLALSLCALAADKTVYVCDGGTGDGSSAEAPQAIPAFRYPSFHSVGKCRFFIIILQSRKNIKPIRSFSRNTLAFSI